MIWRDRKKDYMDGFKDGFLKAWDQMMPLMLEGVELQKKQIYKLAIEENLRSMSDGDKL